MTSLNESIVTPEASSTARPQPLEVLVEAAIADLWKVPPTPLPTPEPSDDRALLIFQHLERYLDPTTSDDDRTVTTVPESLADSRSEHDKFVTYVLKMFDSRIYGLVESNRMAIVKEIAEMHGYDAGVVFGITLLHRLKY